MVALIAGVVVAGVGIAARTNMADTQTARVIKAGQPVTVTSSEISTVR
jgi:hypothetical protein